MACNSSVWFIVMFEAKVFAEERAASAKIADCTEKLLSKLTAEHSSIAKQKHPQLHQPRCCHCHFHCYLRELTILIIAPV